jgi:hypothetical protein
MTEQEKYINALNGLKNADIKIDDEIRYPSIKALEKQIAKKPYLDQKGLLDVKMWHCPVCKKEVISDWNRDLAIDYCCTCGQKLDWGNEDAKV